MRNLLALYLSEADKAGYIIEDHEHPLVLVDRGAFLHILCDDEDEGWFIGRWYKSTPTKSGDYNSHPEFQSESLEDCLKYVRDWTSI